MHPEDTLASVHFGLRTRRLLHYWFPAYNQELSPYSPGLLILMELARAASERGLERIDLGPGDELYKRRVATGFREMGRVSVSAGATMRVLSTILKRVRVWSRGSTLGDGVRAARRVMLRTGYTVAGGSSDTARPVGDDPHARPRILSVGCSPRDADAAVVLLHGRGQEAESMLPLASVLRRPGVVYLAPEAGGRTWYPHRFMAPLEENEPALTSAIHALDGLVDRLGADGVPPQHTVLVGFSQGACLAVEYAARRPRRYGGVVALIGGLFGPEGCPLANSGSLDGTPVFLCASDPDPYVPPGRVRETADVLERLGARVTTRLQRGAGHVITEEGIEGAREVVRAARRRQRIRKQPERGGGRDDVHLRRRRGAGRRPRTPPSAR